MTGPPTQGGPGRGQDRQADAANIGTESSAGCGHACCAELRQRLTAIADERDRAREAERDAWQRGYETGHQVGLQRGRYGLTGTWEDESPGYPQDEP